MAFDNPDRQGFIDAIAKRINAMKSMGTWNTSEAIYHRL